MIGKWSFHLRFKIANGTPHHQGFEIEIPKLEEWIHQKLEVSDLRVGAALQVTDSTNALTKFMTKSRLKKYQQTVFAELEKARDRLLP